MAETKRIPADAIDDLALTDADFARTGSAPFTIELRVRVQALVIPERAGGYSIIVPALPGCVSDAVTIEEVQANATEAAEGWLEVQHDLSKDQAIETALGE